MAWIELHQNLPDHPKLKSLARDIGAEDRDLVRAKLENLWLWCLDYRDNGRLTGMSDADIAVASRWIGDASLWVSKLIRNGWLDKTRGGKGGRTLQIHDWWDFAGRLITLRIKNRERMKRARAPHVPSTCEATNQPDLTVPTKPNQTRPDQPPSPTLGGLKQSFEDLKTPEDDFSKRMAQAWKSHKWGGAISMDLAIQKIRFAVDRKAKPAEIEAAFWDESKCRGRNIWEVLEIVTPQSNGQPEYDKFGDEIK